MDVGLGPGTKPISEDESPAYKELQRKIERQFEETHPFAMRSMIFCIAYTLYKKEKKEAGHRLRKDDESHDPASIVGNVNKVLANEDHYDRFINQAVIHLSAITDATSNQVLSKIGGTIIDGVVQKLPDDLAGRKKSSWIQFRDFFKRSFNHAIEIIMAAIIIVSGAKILGYVGPFISQWLEQIGIKYFS